MCGAVEIAIGTLDKRARPAALGTGSRALKLAVVANEGEGNDRLRTGSVGGACQQSEENDKQERFFHVSTPPTGNCDEICGAVSCLIFRSRIGVVREM